MATMQAAKRSRSSNRAVVQVRVGQIERMIARSPQPSQKLQEAMDRRRRAKLA